MDRPSRTRKGQRGAPAKHGAKFKLSAPSRPADQQDTFQLGEQTVTLQAWEGLHFKKLPDLVGMVLKVEFLRPDGTPRYKRPMWLFWTGPDNHTLEGSVSDVSLAVRHRAFLPFSANSTWG